jgi:hypothetical protein
MTYCSHISIFSETTVPIGTRFGIFSLHGQHGQGLCFSCGLECQHSHMTQLYVLNDRIFLQILNSRFITLYVICKSKMAVGLGYRLQSSYEKVLN